MRWLLMIWECLGIPLADVALEIVVPSVVCIIYVLDLYVSSSGGGYTGVF
jgi:hypothetical protein